MSFHHKVFVPPDRLTQRLRMGGPEVVNLSVAELNAGLNNKCDNVTKCIGNALLRKRRPVSGSAAVYKFFPYDHLNWTRAQFLYKLISCSFE